MQWDYNGTLLLGGNQLTSLPDSFGSITLVVICSNLGGNQLQSLPDSFGSITVGGDLLSLGNPLVDISHVIPNVNGQVYR